MRSVATENSGHPVSEVRQTQDDDLDALGAAYGPGLELGRLAPHLNKKAACAEGGREAARPELRLLRAGSDLQ